MDQFNWSPGIGDPTIGGWLTVVLYLLAVWTTWRASRTTAGRERMLWTAISVMFLALGINKQLDLQTAFTEIGRIVAFKQGWYNERQIVQLHLIETVAVICVAIALMLVLLAYDAPFSTWFGLVGMTIVLAFVLIRAASFHHIDRFIGERVLGLKWNWVLEMGGILIALFASEQRRRTAALVHSSCGG